MYWVVAIVALGFLIVVHELGHYVVARWCSMKIERFSVGFGPALLSRTSKKTGTVFQIAPIPFGGFVEIKGMNIVEDVDPDDPHAYPNRPAWQRFLTIFAGPATNWISAFFLALLLFTVHGVDSTERWWGVASVKDGYDATTKLKPDDRILAVDGQPLWMLSPTGTQDDLVAKVSAHQGAPVTLTVRRAGKTLDVAVTPKADKDKDGKPVFYLGIVPAEQSDAVDVGFFGALREAAAYPVTKSKEILGMFAHLIHHPKDTRLSGAGGIASAFKRAFSTGWVQGLKLLMMLSVYLALFNLFPLPALDGGRLVFLTYELVTRRRANPRIESTVHMVGILLLVVLMVVATVSDIVR